MGKWHHKRKFSGLGTRIKTISQNPNATPRSGGSHGGSHLGVGGSRGGRISEYAKSECDPPDGGVAGGVAFEGWGGRGGSPQTHMRWPFVHP